MNTLYLTLALSFLPYYLLRALTCIIVPALYVLHSAPADAISSAAARLHSETFMICHQASLQYFLHSNSALFCLYIFFVVNNCGVFFHFHCYNFISLWDLFLKIQFSSVQHKIKPT